MTDRFSRKDITGMKRWKLTAIEDVGEDKHGNRLWRFRCDCGGERITTVARFLGDHTKSCGCLKKESALNALSHIDPGAHYKTHGLTGTPEYKLYKQVHNRCYNKNSKSYKNYGGRGITMCDEWNGHPEVFCAWVRENKHQKGLQLDRKDNEKGYSPDNCQFVTPRQNSLNRRTTLRLPTGESLIVFCERWLGYTMERHSKEFKKIQYCWRAHKRLPDFVFEAMRKRAIADLDAAHK